MCFLHCYFASTTLIKNPLKTTKPFRKFKPLQKKIEELEKNNSRFRRIYSEYETMTEELWNLESSGEISVTDDFINSIKLQASYLEDEIQDWLIDDESEKQT